MGVEVLLLYLVTMLVAGPGTVFYGLWIVYRGRVWLTGDAALGGKPAVALGTAMCLAGAALSYFLWRTAHFFRP